MIFDFGLVPYGIEIVSIKKSPLFDLWQTNFFILKKIKQANGHKIGW